MVAGWQQERGWAFYNNRGPTGALRSPQVASRRQQERKARRHLAQVCAQASHAHPGKIETAPLHPAALQDPLAENRVGGARCNSHCCEWSAVRQHIQKMPSHRNPSHRHPCWRNALPWLAVPRANESQASTTRPGWYCTRVTEVDSTRRYRAARCLLFQVHDNRGTAGDSLRGMDGTTCMLSHALWLLSRSTIESVSKPAWVQMWARKGLYPRRGPHLELPTLSNDSQRGMEPKKYSASLQRWRQSVDHSVRK